MAELWRIDMARITSDLRVALVAEAASKGHAHPVAAGAPLVSDWGRAALAVAAVLNRWVGAGIIREGNAAWPVDELLRAACEGPGGLR